MQRTPTDTTDVVIVLTDGHATVIHPDGMCPDDIDKTVAKILDRHLVEMGGCNVCGSRESG